MAADINTGFQDLQIQDEHGSRTLNGFIWYPTAETQGIKTVQGNKVWQGIEAIENATLTAGKHPLAILSHGIMGTAMSQAWLAQALSKQGFIVAAVHHPGTSFFADDATERREL